MYIYIYKLMTSHKCFYGAQCDQRGVRVERGTICTRPLCNLTLLCFN